MTHQDQELSGEMVNRIALLAESSPYSVHAFNFVLDGFSYKRIRDDTNTHIDADLLCWRLHDLALRRFGRDARTNLENWGIRRTIDFGHIVYALIDAGLAVRTEEDKLEEFESVFDFDDQFTELKDPVDIGRPYQWRLSSMLVITTLVAITCAGAASLGISGAIASLFSAWIGLVGIVCLFLGVRDKTRHGIISIVFGMTLTAASIVLFLTATWRE